MVELDERPFRHFLTERRGSSAAGTVEVTLTATILTKFGNAWWGFADSCIVLVGVRLPVARGRLCNALSRVGSPGRSLDPDQPATDKAVL